MGAIPTRLDNTMTEKQKPTVDTAHTQKESGNHKTHENKPPLWLGAGKERLDMGFGRGPRTLEGHELVSWFFSRDGIWSGPRWAAATPGAP